MFRRSLVENRGMARQEPKHHGDPVVAAINRVLKTERDGVEALRHAEEEGRRRQSEARGQATAMARRADACITRMHAAYLKKTDEKITVLAATNPPGDAARSYDRATLTAAARRVAAMLTGDT